MATLREVATLAEVSTATVSKVLSNTPYVSAETRERVLHAVQTLGYEPNLAARALSKGKTYNIGVVFPYNYDHLFADPHTLAILEGVETECTQRGYNILLSTPRVPVEQSDQLRRLVRSGYLDGVIALETLPAAPVSAMLEQFRHPWIAIGTESVLGPLNTVQSDDFSGAKAIAAHLIALGHRQIGIIGVEDIALAAAERRMEGYRAAFEEAGLDFARVPKVVGNFSTESGHRAAGELLALEDRPTAVLCLNDRMAIGAIQRAYEGGLSVPEALSVAGFDDIPNAATLTPPLTTVRQPAYAMGRKAAEMLFERITVRPTRSARVMRKADIRNFPPVVFAAEMVVRGSTTAHATEARP